MKKKEVWHGHNTARFIYYSYKDSPYYVLLILTVIVSVIILLIFNIIIPQTQNWLSIRDESEATRQRIEVLKNNLSYMSTLNKNTLEKNRQTVIRALPVEKGFSDIINAVALSSMKSGIIIEDFNFSLGPIASSSATTLRNADGTDVVNLILSIKGEIEDVKKFIAEIGESLPLGEIVTADTGKGDTSISLQFYSKSYRALKITDSEPILPISVENLTVLSTLTGKSERMGAPSEETAVPASDIPLF